jgi:hypothetical protein
MFVPPELCSRQEIGGAHRRPGPLRERNSPATCRPHVSHRHSQPKAVCASPSSTVGSSNPRGWHAQNANPTIHQSTYLLTYRSPDPPTGYSALPQIQSNAASAAAAGSGKPPPHRAPKAAIALSPGLPLHKSSATRSAPKTQSRCTFQSTGMRHEWRVRGGAVRQTRHDQIPRPPLPSRKPWKGQRQERNLEGSVLL